MIGLALWLFAVSIGTVVLTNTLLSNSTRRVEQLLDEATKLEAQERSLMEKLRRFEEQVHVRWPSEVDR